jgi:hypothetical protein
VPPLRAPPAKGESGVSGGARLDCFEVRRARAGSRHGRDERPQARMLL